MSATVVVIGGGYGGITIAQALDDVADVILIDPKDAFVHNVAVLRAVVDPAWIDKIFFPYENLLKRGSVVRDWVVSADPHGVHLVSGGRIDADFVVLAMGTTYPFPAKLTTHHADAGRYRLHKTAAELAKAHRVLLLGAGAVGLELAGEIKAVSPHKSVTIVDPAPDILSHSFHTGFPEELRAKMRHELRAQLDQLGVQLLTGTSVSGNLPTAGEAGAFTAVTRSGHTVTADIWFRCFGRQPASGNLSGELAFARRRDAYLTVGADLRLVGQRNVFAIGDVAAAGAPDTAVIAMEQGTLVADSIRGLIQGGSPPGAYQPSQPVFLVPVGPHKGSGYSPDAGILDAETTSMFKGQDLLVTRYAEIFGLTGR